MKTKISKIMGVGLALVLVFGLSFALMPTEKAQADEGNMQWLAQPQGGNAATYNVLAKGTDVLEFAVAADGHTLYAIDDSQPANTAPPAAAALYYSPNAGQQWIPIFLNNVVGIVAYPLGNVAVAPDNPAVVAISTFDASDTISDLVYITTNGGISWTRLPALAGAAATMKIKDLKVSPARSGTLLGREYLVATADGANATVTRGTLQIVGATATWACVAESDQIVFTDAVGGAVVTLAPTSGATTDFTAVVTGGGNYAPATGIITFVGVGTATLTATAHNLAGTWTSTAAVGLAAGNDFDVDVAVTGSGLLLGTYSVPDGTDADFMACEFSPGYVGDRIVVGVGNTNAAGGTFAYTFSTQSGARLRAVDIDVTTANLSDDYVAGGAAGNSITFADIAMPIDYDYTTPGFERYWASWASGATVNGDAVRCDDGLPAYSMQLAGTPIRSIAYSGTIVGGTMFASYTNATAALATQIVYTTGATTNIPSWLPSFKPPTGNGTIGAYVRLSPNFLGDKTVYAGTTGSGAQPDESAFSVSTNGGVTYNQESLIDQEEAAAWGAEDFGTIDSMLLTPDGKTLFMATDDGAQLSVWQTATPVSPISWQRIFCVTAAGPGLLALNKAEWDTNPEIYLFDTAAGGGTNGLYASYDGGNIFSTRSLPGAPATLASVESSKTLYIALGTNACKSTNGGLVWGPPTPTNAGAALNSLVACGGGHVLVGGTGGCSLSSDGGANFAPLTPFGLGGTAYLAIPDEGYATNNLVYAADTAAAGSIFRLDVVNGTAWDNLAATGAAKGGIGMSNGCLYGMNTGAGLGCERTLGPHDAAGTLTWNRMSAGAAGITNLFDVGANHVYTAVGATPVFYAYNDYLATTVPVATSPANGATVPNDPVTGRALPVTVSWNVMGTGTGMVNTYLIFVWPKATGFTSATIYTTGVLGPFSTAPTVVLQNLASGPPGFTGPGFVGFAGVEYQWLVQAVDEISGDAIDSPFSSPPPAAPSFKVAAGIPQTEMVPPLEVPTVTVPPVTVPPAEVVSPAWIWAVVIIGAILVIAVIALIFTTRRTP